MKKGDIVKDQDGNIGFVVSVKRMTFTDDEEVEWPFHWMVTVMKTDGTIEKKLECFYEIIVM